MNARVPYPVTQVIRSELARAVRRELDRIELPDGGGDGGDGGGGGGTIAQVVWEGSWPERPAVPTVWWVGGPTTPPPNAEPGDIYFPRAV